MRPRDRAFLFALLGLFIACIARDPRSDELPFRSFHPLPDAIEYAIGAANIRGGLGPVLTINGQSIPSRYPFGFPLVIAGFYSVLGNDVVNAYYVSIVFGAACIPLMFALALAVCDDPRVARWSAFFLATNSLFLSFSTLVMAEVFSVFLALVALNVAVRLRAGGGVLGLVALGMALGYGLLVRPANVLMIPPVVLYLVGTRRLRVRSPRSLALVLAIGSCVGALLLYNARVFGSPLRDGYALHTPRPMLAWRFFTANAWPYFETLALARGGKSIWLEGPFYGPLVPLLALVGMAVLLREGRRDVVGLAAAWVSSFYVFYSCFFFYDFRFFLPVLPVVLLVAARGLGTLLGFFSSGAGRRVASAVVVVLYLVQPLSGGESALTVARRNRTSRDAPANYVHVGAINSYMAGIGARPETHFVMSALNLVYHDYFSSKRYTLLPLSRDQEYARVPEIAARMGTRDVDELLARGCLVYLSDFAADDDHARAALRELAERYRLEPIPGVGTSLVRLLART